MCSFIVLVYIVSVWHSLHLFFFMISWLLFMCSFILLFSHLFGILCIYIFCFIIFSTENSLCLHELAVYEISNHLASDTTFHILDICNHSSENLIYLRGMNFLNSSCTLIICILKLSAEFKVFPHLSQAYSPSLPCTLSICNFILSAEFKIFSHLSQANSPSLP